MIKTQQKNTIGQRIRTSKNALVSLLRKYRKKMLNRTLPLKGYTSYSINTKYLDILGDDDLDQLNNILDWNCFTTDSHGRRFGMAAWGSKRDKPEVIPDRRITMMHEKFNLANKHVLEVGCFEGIHSLGLLQYTDRVTAIDARMDHVVKTIVRCAMFGYHPTVFKYDIEKVPADASLLEADFIHHVGVLYHLIDPVNHLIGLGKYIKYGVMLDTHYCLPDDATETYQVNGQKYSYKRYLEHGQKEAFSGMYDHSKWLLMDDIIKCLQDAGFGKVEIVEQRQERNGPRVLLFAERG